VFDRVVARFGPGILDEAGDVDRNKLARLVFDREDERAALNAITHPPVMEEISEWAALAKARGQVAVAMVPLLFEVGAEKFFDAVICVAADEKVVLQRLKNRGLNENDARKRLRAQWPLAEKIECSDEVIYNDGDLASLREKTKKAYQNILKKERDAHG
jgi:dephospho-CoA kinase